MRHSEGWSAAPNSRLNPEKLMTLSLQNVSKQYGANLLFDNVNAQIGYHSRIALIGPNGSGKSTLLKIILNQETPDSGLVQKAKHLAVGYLAQEVPKFAGRSILEEVLRLDGRREELLLSKKELEEKFAVTSGLQEGYPDLDHYARVLEELEHLDEYRIESRAKEILTGMGFKPRDFGRNLREFSGGWLMRVALSRVLLMDPDLMLLDEPTNHLDLESLLWLEDFLKSYTGAMLLVSHDTAFLNRIVDEVYEIDQAKLWTYRGNLHSYASQKQERLTLLRAQHANQQAKIAEIEAFVARFGAKATKARQAQSRLKQLEKMELIELPEDRSSIRFHFPPAPHSGKEVVTLKGASASFGDKKVLENLDWVIQRGARIAIVGVNGAGKTTLLKLLAGKLEPSGGLVKLGHAVVPGYYAQLQAESLDLRKTILEELEQIAPDLPVARVRSIAGAFLFTGDTVEKKCAVLSGGEKARVALAKLLLSPSNFLILDEPTNHLDVESRGVLLDALADYQGTLCLVSHDRDFVTPLVDTLLEITPSTDSGHGSTARLLIEDYQAYLDRKTREIRETRRTDVPRAEPKQEQPASAAPKGPSNNKLRAWRAELDTIELEIARMEDRESELNALLADPELYNDKERSRGLIEEHRLLHLTIAEKIARWEELCSLLGDA